MRSIIAAAALVCLVSPAMASYSSITLWNPKVGSRPLDWCLWPATQCGKPAADNYCRSKGYGKALGFDGQRSVRPTYIMGTGEICSRGRFDHCDRFTRIQCSFR